MQMYAITKQNNALHETNKTNNPINAKCLFPPFCSTIPYPKTHPHSKYSTKMPPAIIAASRSVWILLPFCAMSRTRPAEFLSDVWKDAKTSFYLICSR
jgi:hypothetical protein